MTMQVVVNIVVRNGVTVAANAVNEFVDYCNPTLNEK